MTKLLLAFTCLMTLGCENLKKDNEPKEPQTESEQVQAMLPLYREGVQAHLDEQGFVIMDKSLGDSALFSCIAYFSDAVEFDPSLLISPEGKPVRHPLVWQDQDEWFKRQCTPANRNPEKSLCTPISKDMVAGVGLCLYQLGQRDRDAARDLTVKIIDYGRANKENGLWKFCTDQEIDRFEINSEDVVGKCLMTPAVSKDIYRLAISFGWECDADCQITFNTTGVNLPGNNTGFQRHLAVLTTVRNGLVEGAINDNSLDIVLKNAAESNERNALYQAAYNLFLDGDQAAAYKALTDRTYFPADRIPTEQEYCTDYLFQRDYIKPGETEVNKDWLPCDKAGSKGRGIDWLFAEKLTRAARD